MQLSASFRSRCACWTGAGHGGSCLIVVRCASITSCTTLLMTMCSARAPRLLPFSSPFQGGTGGGGDASAGEEEMCDAAALCCSNQQHSTVQPRQLSASSSMLDMKHSFRAAKFASLLLILSILGLVPGKCMTSRLACLHCVYAVLAGIMQVHSYCYCC
jgi:hypothetical protein